jgi:hypothetical protein
MSYYCVCVSLFKLELNFFFVSVSARFFYNTKLGSYMVSQGLSGGTRVVGTLYKDYNTNS